VKQTPFVCVCTYISAPPTFVRIGQYSHLSYGTTFLQMLVIYSVIIPSTSQLCASHDRFLPHSFRHVRHSRLYSHLIPSYIVSAADRPIADTAVIDNFADAILLDCSHGCGSRIQLPRMRRRTKHSGRVSD
jgi:hypothetical protein